MDIGSWIKQCELAWCTKDADRAAELFVEDALYFPHVAEKPHRGRAQIRTYWGEVTATQREMNLRFSEPLIVGRRATVEWWAMFRDVKLSQPHADDRVTLPGCMVLRFAENGLCEELREYWYAVIGAHVSAPEGWGQ